MTTPIRLNGLNLGAQINTVNQAVDDAEAEKVLAQTARAGAETAKAGAEAARAGAEAAQSGAEDARDLATEISLGDAAAALEGYLLANDLPANGSDLLASIVDEAGRLNAAKAIIPSDAGDISLALRRAALAAEPFGAAVYLPDGDYTAFSVLEAGDLTNVRFELAAAARITVSFDGTFVRVGHPTFEVVQSMTPPAGVYWGDRMTVGVTDASVYAVNDLVKAVADDKAPSTRATPGDGTDYRIGQYAVVTAVDTGANTLTLDRPLDPDYAWSTNPRIGRLPRRRVTWRGGIVGYEQGHEADWHGSAFIAYGVSDLSIETEIEHTYNAAVGVVGCFSPSLNIVGRDLRNNAGNQQYGYLVNDSSEYAEVRVKAGRNRHAYTTNMPLVAADSADLHLYGETRAALVKGRCDGNSQAGFDTHHGSVGVVFSNVVSTGGTTGGGQLVLRGRKHRIISPTLRDGKEGILVYSEAGVNSQTTGIEIIDPDVEIDRYPLVVDKASASLSGGRLRSLRYGRVISLTATSALRLVGHVRLRPGGPAEVNGNRCVNIVDATVDATGAVVTFDLQDIPSGATSYGIVQGDGATAAYWKGGRIITINDTELSTAFYKNAAATGVINFGGNGMSLETSKAGGNPKTTMDLTGANGVGFTGPWTWRDLTGGGSTRYIERTISADGYVLPWYNRDDDVVVARLFVNTTPRTLGALPSGTKVGQILHLSVTLAGGATLTLKHGSATYKTSLKGAADIVFGAETGVTLMWNGAVWTSVVAP